VNNQAARRAQPNSCPLFSVILASVFSLALLAASPAFAQHINPAEEKPSEPEQPISYGVELGFGSGHADRGFVISDRPVFQPVLWVSGSVATLSVWGNLTLDETTDGSRPQIVEMELTHAREWGNVTIEPALRMFVYRDPVSIYSSRSIEGWLYLSYDARLFRLVTNHSLDALTYRGAYYGDAGIEIDQRVSPRFELGGSLKAGWTSAKFNDAYVGVDKPAFSLINVESWLAASVKHLYIRPFVRFSAIVDRAVRSQLSRPTLFLAGLATGVEF
jgi:hypothetical protein